MAVQKFSTQVDSEILSDIRHLAQSEGRRLQALIDEALADLIEKRKKSRPRAHVLAAYQGSHETYSKLYRQLAK